MNILDILAKKHQTWIKYMHSFGCSKDIAEDYVQEMYIKIYNYSLKSNNDLMYDTNDVNYFFIYVTLKNMYYDDLRKNKRLNVIEIDSINEIDDSEIYIEDDFQSKLEMVQKWEDSIILKINKIKGYNSDKAGLQYILFIYQKCFKERIPVSELSREVGISYWSLRNTIQIIKNQIKDEK